MDQSQNEDKIDMQWPVTSDECVLQRVIHLSNYFSVTSRMVARSPHHYYSIASTVTLADIEIFVQVFC